MDLMKLEGVPSVRLHARRDFTSRGSNFFIRWTEVFFLAHSSDLEPSDHMTTASCLAKAISVTLSPFLEKLIKAGMSTVAIRVNLDVEKASVFPWLKFVIRLVHILQGVHLVWVHLDLILTSCSAISLS